MSPCPKCGAATYPECVKRCKDVIAERVAADYAERVGKPNCQHMQGDDGISLAVKDTGLRCLDCIYREKHAAEATAAGITAADKVVALLSLLNADECSVILRVTERMVSGRQQYGGLNLAVDRRDWTAEAEAESLDLLAYLAMRTLTRGRGT